MIDKDFTDHHKLPFITKKHPIPIKVIGGRPLISWDVTHETIPLDIVLERHRSIIAFNVIKSLLNLVVIGFSWLNKYNSIIDWKIGRLAFQPNIASIQESGHRETSSAPDHQ
jgi:hypothetical protein